MRVRPLSAAERAARAVDVVTCVPSTRGSPRSRRCTSRAPRLTAQGTSSPLGSISTARSTRAPPTRTSTRRRSSPSCDSASRATRRPRTRRPPRCPRAAARRRRRERDRLRVRADGQREDAHDDWLYLLLARDVCLGAREKNCASRFTRGIRREVFRPSRRPRAASARLRMRAAACAWSGSPSASCASRTRCSRSRKRARRVARRRARTRTRRLRARTRCFRLRCGATWTTRKRAGPPRATRVLSRRGSRWLTSPVPSVARTGARRSPSVSGGRARRSTRRCSR